MSRRNKPQLDQTQEMQLEGDSTTNTLVDPPRRLVTPLMFKVGDIIRWKDEPKKFPNDGEPLTGLSVCSRPTWIQGFTIVEVRENFDGDLVARCSWVNTRLPKGAWPRVWSIHERNFKNYKILKSMGVE